MSTLTALHAAVMSELGTSAGYLQAIWQEADGSGGYIVHPDGRMVLAGDYQMGLSHVNDFLNAPNTGDPKRELALLLGHLTDLTPDVQSEAVDGYWTWALGKSFPTALHSHKNGTLTFDELFDLAASAGRTGYTPNGAPSFWVTLAQNVFVNVLELDQNGKPAWVSHVAGETGERFPGDYSVTGSTIHTPFGAVGLLTGECAHVARKTVSHNV